MRDVSLSSGTRSLCGQRRATPSTRWPGPPARRAPSSPQSPAHPPPVVGDALPPSRPSAANALARGLVALPVDDREPPGHPERLELHTLLRASSAAVGLPQAGDHADLCLTRCADQWRRYPQSGRPRCPRRRGHRVSAASRTTMSSHGRPRRKAPVREIAREAALRGHGRWIDRASSPRLRGRSRGLGPEVFQDLDLADRGGALLLARRRRAEFSSWSRGRRARGVRRDRGGDRRRARGSSAINNDLVDAHAPGASSPRRRDPATARRGRPRADPRA